MNMVESPKRYSLVGMEIEADWNDGQRYKAVVVAYSARLNKYRVVYTRDHNVETVSLEHVRYRVLDKRYADEEPANIGRVVEFCYPHDGRYYKAIVYREEPKIGLISISYLDYAVTDNLVGGGWQFLSRSPCLMTHGRKYRAQRLLSTAWYARVSDDSNGAGFEIEEEENCEAVVGENQESVIDILGV